MEVVKRDDMSRDLVPFREPADINKQVALAQEKLNEIKILVSSSSENKVGEINKTTIDEIISSFEQMNSERMWLLDAVEEETIRSSVYRHKLEEFPRDIEGEIKDAVRSARDSNKARIKTLKDELGTIEKDISNLKQRNEELTSSNATLQPEQSELQNVHKKYIEELNEALLMKANMQIKLNETREEIRETISKAADLHQACEEMKEDMVAEQHDAVIEENRLTQDIDETMKKVVEQQDRNVKKKQEVLSQEDRCISAEKILQNKRDLIKNHEANIAKLQELCNQHREELIKRDLESQNKTKLCEELRKRTDELISSQEKDLNDFHKNMETLNSEIDEAQIDHDQLQAQKIRATNLLDTALLSGRKDKDEADEMQKSLRVAKDDLLHQSSECSRLKRENIELEYQIQKVIEDHIGAADVLRKQIETIETHLDEERIERKKLQLKRDEIHKEMSDFMTEFNKFSSLTLHEINEGRAQHSALSQEGGELQSQCKLKESMIHEKQLKLQEDKSSYLSLQKDSKLRETMLMESIEELKRNIDETTNTLQDELPDFEQLKDTYKRKSEDFEKMKKLIVEVKSMKTDLETTVETKNSKLEEMIGPKEKLEKELEEKREMHLNILKEQSEEIVNLESDILHTTTQYKAVKQQNQRFKKAIQFFQNEVKTMRSRMNEMSEEKRSIEHNLSEYRDWLELQWRNHMQLDKEYYDEDILLLDDIKKVAEITSQREKKVEGIHKQLEEQLARLSNFLDDAVRLKTPCN